MGVTIKTKNDEGPASPKIPEIVVTLETTTDEQRRLDALNRYGILDSLPEQSFDDLNLLMTQVCNTPIALINLIDQSRVWFKSAIGTEIREFSRYASFCNHVIQTKKLTVVPDATVDERFKNHPLVIGPSSICFYAGYPLITPDGEAIGTVCVFDTVKRQLSEPQASSLRLIANQVMQLLEVKLKSRSQSDATKILTLLNSVAVEANASSTPLEIAEKCLQQVCEFAQAPVGHYLGLDPENPKQLVSSGIWYMKDPVKHRAFRDFGLDLKFTSGYGLPGKVIETKRPVWISDMANYRNLPRADLCLSLNLTSVFAFPVLLQNEVVGVFEFVMPHYFEPDDGLFQVMEHVGTQFARVLERSRSESALEQQSTFLNAVLENLSDGIVACNENGEFDTFNRATRELYGVADQGQHVLPQDWPKYFRLYMADGKTPVQFADLPLYRAFRGEQVKDVELVVELVSGERRHTQVNGCALYRKDGSKMGAVIAMKNITESRSAKAKLETSAKTLQMLIDTNPTGILVLDKSLNVTMWNTACEKIFGWTKEEVLGGPLPVEPGHEAENMKKVIEKVRRTRSIVEHQSDRYHKSGKIINVRVSVAPIFDGSQEVSGFIGVVIDITDIKQNERNLIESNQALQRATMAKSEFLANMSHELRTPLNGVMGMAAHLMDSELTLEQKDSLQSIQTSAENLLKIISDILDFSKIEAGKLEIESINFDLSQVVSEVHQTLTLSANERALEFNKILPKGQNAMFVGDPGRIRQVLLNLLSNSIKFTDHGHITTSLKIQTAAPGISRIRIEVEDTGVGIPKEVVSKLFQAFSQADSSTTRRFGGTGLGLSISKRLIDLMGGEIHVESEVGRGTKFWFTLELPDSQIKPETLRPVHLTAKHTDAQFPLSILLAEDNPINQKVTVQMLARLGLKADIAENGLAVLEAVASKPYDLILMDCHMPEMDGYEAARAIRTNPKCGLTELIIIALTASAMKGDREKCLAAGMNDYVSKPFKIEDLESAISRNVIKSLRVA